MLQFQQLILVYLELMQPRSLLSRIAAPMELMVISKTSSLFLLIFMEKAQDCHSLYSLVICRFLFTGMGFLYDCVIIDGLSSSKGKPLTFQNVCGLGGLFTKSTAVADATKQATLCSKLFIYAFSHNQLLREIHRTCTMLATKNKRSFFQRVYKFTAYTAWFCASLLYWEYCSMKQYIQ